MVWAWVTQNEEAEELGPGGTKGVSPRTLPFCKRLETWLHGARHTYTLERWSRLPVIQQELPKTPHTQDRAGARRDIKGGRPQPGRAAKRTGRQELALLLTLGAKPPEGTLTCRRASPGRTAGPHSSTACTRPSRPPRSAWCSWGDTRCPRAVNTQAAFPSWGPSSVGTEPSHSPRGPFYSKTQDFSRRKNSFPKRYTPGKWCQKRNLRGTKK